MDDIFTQVKTALQGVKHGETKEFNFLLSVFTDPSSNQENFNNYIKALKNTIIEIKKEHETLIGVILNIDWLKLEQSSVDLLIEFIIELVSAKAYYLRVCVRSLIRHFSTKGELNDDELPNFKVKLEHVHHTLKLIMNLAPLSLKFIVENINILFPYIGKSLFVLETYIMNALQVTTYCPVVRYQILSICIDKMMSIDVRIPQKEFEEHDTDEENNLQFGDGVEDNFLTQKLTTNANVAKLDQLMVILFTYVHSVCHHDNNLDVLQANILFNELLQVFVDVIMKTQQSLHVQFVIFYAASFNENFSQAFIQCCWKLIENPNVASIIRQASAGYLSSFLARAKFIGYQCVMKQLQNLTSWVHRYIDAQDSNMMVADFDKHGPFYGVCQALFYVFIYHHKHFMNARQDRDLIKSLNFMRIITCRLNPLKFCLNTVVSMFARITRMYEIVFCYSVIERNNRNALSELTFSGFDVVKPSSQMEMFFPFDPYVLEKSKEYIKPLYLEWTGSVVDELSDNTDDEDTSENLSELNDDKRHELTHNVANSFDMMCISPGFSLIHTES